MKAVSESTLMRVMKEIGSAMKEYVARELAPLKAELAKVKAENASLKKDLDAREWKGVWSDATKYEKHNTVTWDGGSWYAARDSIGRRPGQSDDWRLIVQRGKQGKKGDAA